MSGDATLRNAVGGLPSPEFDTAPASLGKPLSEAKVAIVTTAGLKRSGEVELWQPGDGSYTVIPADARDLQLSHFSPNFDRSGIAADLNVVYPIDRLNELAEAGIIGSVAERHLSFMGAQFDFASIVQDTAPRAAQELIDDGVDVVIFTPV
ncbi:MAG: glycine/sarcosine/betaine reductase selenoprotein B family protein [Ilumatobacter sp.]